MGVPYAWTKLIEHQRQAQIERDVMCAAEVGSPTHDIAMQKYIRAVDVVMECLCSLSQDQTLGRITLFLARKERA